MSQRNGQHPGVAGEPRGGVNETDNGVSRADKPYHRHGPSELIQLGDVGKNGLTRHSEGERVFSTGGVARVCRCAPRTAAKWFDSGRLKGYLLPGSRDRRIPESCLLEFMRDEGFPIPPWMLPAAVLVVCPDANDLADVGENWTVAENLVDAVEAVVKGRWARVFVTDAVGVSDAARVCNRAAHDKYAKVVLILSDGVSEPAGLSERVEVVRRPVNWESLS